MLTHPTLEKLKGMRLSGMVSAFEDQMNTPEIKTLGFEERLGLLVDREQTERENRRLKTRLTKAKLRQSASMEDIKYSGNRGLDKAQLLDLGSCKWINERHNLLLTGPTGVGKTFIACALAQKACREGLTSLYLRLPRLFGDLTIAKGDGRYGKLLVRYSKVDLIVLDDWGISPMTAENRRDLLEILDDLNALGMMIEPFGETTFVIKAVPSIIDEKEVKPIILDIIETALNKKDKFSKEAWLDNCLISMACHGAVRANASLNQKEITQLLIDLEKCENSRHCPHGRPIIAAWTKNQMEKLFKRVV